MLARLAQRHEIQDDSPVGRAVPREQEPSQEALYAGQDFLRGRQTRSVAAGTLKKRERQRGRRHTPPRWDNSRTRVSKSSTLACPAGLSSNSASSWRSSVSMKLSIRPTYRAARTTGLLVSSTSPTEPSHFLMGRSLTIAAEPARRHHGPTLCTLPLARSGLVLRQLSRAGHEA